MCVINLTNHYNTVFLKKQVLFWDFSHQFRIATGKWLCYNEATVREGPAPTPSLRDGVTEKEDEMDILTSLMQLFGNCAGSTCAGQAAQAAAPAAEAATTAMGGLSGLITLLCRLFGIGC